jgi:hypothetical protein
MTISMPIVLNLPPLIVFITMVPLLFLTAVCSYQYGRNVEIRSNERAIRKAVQQMCNPPWYVTGEADRIERPSPEITIFKARPYVRDEEEQMALAA